MSAALIGLATAAAHAAAAANRVTLTLTMDGVHVLAQGRPDVVWPNLPAASETVSWIDLATQPDRLAAMISTLDHRITTLRAERIEKEAL
ncbi:hypothetical protein [Phenylobacterium sp.]|uniref:hypothetical protein n=1 Tax=Phenylobacterium sp. TaxID=1871053 RepID=UPI0027344C00|nr:hypothetical protein [Phenylobacterium sp.]MDP3853177.1 hypothetical protein [Phenylobacterium sp.]